MAAWSGRASHHNRGHVTPRAVIFDWAGPAWLDDIEGPIARPGRHRRLGTRLSVSKLTPEALRDKVRQAATKAAGARRVAAGYAAAGGAAAGPDAVEGLLKNNPRVGPRK